MAGARGVLNARQRGRRRGGDDNLPIHDDARVEELDDDRLDADLARARQRARRPPAAEAPPMMVVVVVVLRGGVRRVRLCAVVEQHADAV